MLKILDVLERKFSLKGKHLLVIFIFFFVMIIPFCKWLKTTMRQPNFTCSVYYIADYLNDTLHNVNRRFFSHNSDNDNFAILEKVGPQIFRNSRCYYIYSELYDVTKFLKPNVEKHEIKEKRKKQYFQAKAIFKNLRTEVGDRIPHISHRTWLTSSTNPYEVPKEKLDYYLSSISRLGKDWSHIFWCLDKTKIPQTIHYLEKSSIPIEIKELKEIVNMKGAHIIKAYLQENRFTSANDIIRMNIVNTYGGIYSDIGAEYTCDITPLLDAFDYIFLNITENQTSFIDTGLFAAKPYSPVLTAYLKNIDKIYFLSDDIKNCFKMARDQFYWCTSPQYVHCVDFYSSENDRVLLLPMNAIVRFNRLGSWLGDGKFGNTPYEKSKVFIFDVKPENY